MLCWESKIDLERQLSRSILGKNKKSFKLIQFVSIRNHLVNYYVTVYSSRYVYSIVVFFVYIYLSVNIYSILEIIPVNVLSRYIKKFLKECIAAMFWDYEKPTTVSETEPNSCKCFKSIEPFVLHCLSRFITKHFLAFLGFELDFSSVQSSKTSQNNWLFSNQGLTEMVVE